MDIALVDAEDANNNIVPGQWRQHVQLDDLNVVGAVNRASLVWKRHCEYLREYFNSVAGSVAWQERMV
jgi:hypothetical protein